MLRRDDQGRLSVASRKGKEMITTKQRAYLRSLANSIEPTTQLGKLGIGDNVLKTVSLALEAHELVKLTVLETSPLSPKEVMVELCEALKCEAVQVIGRKVVIYRQSGKEENRRIVLPKK